jgi:hypothetical protein
MYRRKAYRGHCRSLRQWNPAISLANWAEGISEIRFHPITCWSQLRSCASNAAATREPERCPSKGNACDQRQKDKQTQGQMLTRSVGELPVSSTSRTSRAHQCITFMLKGRVQNWSANM